MTALTIPAVNLSSLTLATPHAFEIQPGDLIGASGDWCVVTTWPVPDAPVNPVFVEIEVTPAGKSTLTARSKELALAPLPNSPWSPWPQAQTPPSVRRAYPSEFDVATCTT